MEVNKPEAEKEFGRDVLSNSSTLILKTKKG
jgi:hypothetical protein